MIKLIQCEDGLYRLQNSSQMTLASAQSATSCHSSCSKMNQPLKQNKKTRSKNKRQNHNKRSKLQNSEQKKTCSHKTVPGLAASDQWKKPELSKTHGHCPLHSLVHSLRGKIASGLLIHLKVQGCATQ